MSIRKKSTILATSLVLLLAATGSAQDFFATITNAGYDGRVTINAGTNAELEVGDILVVQAAGYKKGLVRVITVNMDSALAETVHKESGSEFAPGDLVAYQLLQTDMPYWKPNPVYDSGGFEPAPRAKEEFPPWMGEYASKSGTGEQKEVYKPLPDEDSQIAAQREILNKSPRDRRAMCTMADMYFQKGWYDHSIIWNQRAVEADPDAPDNDKLLHQIAGAYASMGDREKSEIYVEYIRRHYPDSVFAYENIEAYTSTRPGPGEWKSEPRLPYLPGSVEIKRLGAGATIKKLPQTKPREVKTGKMKIIPVRKQKSEETED